MDRAEKKEAVAALHEIFSKTSVVVVAQYSGLTVAQMQRLRKQMRQAGASVQVAKNRLAKIALDGTDVAAIGPLPGALPKMRSELIARSRSCA